MQLDRVGTLQPGRYAVLFSGDVASVGESYAEVLRVGGSAVDDHVFLPHVDPAVRAAVLGAVSHWGGDTIGIIETSTLAPIMQAADAALKGANVRLIELRFGDGLGGKGLAHFAGEQHDVEAAIEIGAARVTDGRRTIWTSVTPRFDDELRARFAEGSTRFFGEPSGAKFGD